METELKLESDSATFDVLADHPLLQRYRRGEPQTRVLHSVYFDTDDQALRDAGFTLRVRSNGRGYVQTIKEEKVGGFARGEWERDIAGNRPESGAAKGTALAGLFARRKLRKRLKPIFETTVTRTVHRLEDGPWEVELAVDQGHISAGPRQAPLGEIELELKRGDPTELFALARALREVLPLHLGVRSKAERGYALLADAPVEAVKAEPPNLQSGMTSGEAIQAIGRSCLTHLLRNRPVLLQSRDAEAIHQMRVALRRLRAAISLFRDVLADDKRDPLKARLKSLTNQLSNARDADQFLEKVAWPVFERHSGEPGMEQMIAFYRHRRDDAFEAAVEAVSAREFDDLALDVEAWIETGAWISSEAAARPFDETAADVLGARHRKLIKEARHLDRLDPAERHRMRIQAKKLRYGIEFVDGVWTGRVVNARRKGMQNALERMQDSLGELHDIAVGRLSQRALACEPPDSLSPALARLRAYAVGIVVGDRCAKSEPLIAVAQQAYQDFADCRRFWG
jgi:inorganic triphosphatase YgiF